MCFESRMNSNVGQSNIAGLGCAVGSVSRLALGSSQVPFTAHSFTSCQLLVNG